jgi:hypothetical protein
MGAVAEALHQQAEVATLLVMVVDVVGAALALVWVHKAAWDKATVVKVGLTIETMVTLAMKAVAASLSPAAICLPLNKPCAAPGSARHVAMAAAMVAATAVRHLRPRAQVANLTRCVPALT